MKPGHLRAPRSMSEAFGAHSSGFIDSPTERPPRRRQMLRALLLSIGTVALTALVLFLMAAPQ